MNVVTPESSHKVGEKVFNTPRQNSLKDEIIKINFEIDKLLMAEKHGLKSAEDDKMMKKLQKDLSEKKTCLLSLEKNALRQKHFRSSRKRALVEISQDPQVAKILKIRDAPGQPRIESDQPELLKTIVDLVTFGASTEEKRRNETLNSCKTLDDLHEKLKLAGFNLSRSATYLRLLPKKSQSIEGKKHVVTVPVRLRKAQNDLHKTHVDQYFCTSTIRSIETIASILGPNQVIFLSQDDKARVPLGITAANKQTPMLMHLEYQVSYFHQNFEVTICSHLS